MKKKQSDEMTQFYKFIKEENQEMKSIFKERNTSLQEIQTMLHRNYELQLLRAQNEAKQLELWEQREENQILQKDVNSIEDSMLREALRREQMSIHKRRAQDRQSQGGIESSNTFSQYFGS
ncbi:hypothetical protein ACOSQ2_029137 [Xanthoceras sorbifolium]